MMWYVYSRSGATAIVAIPTTGTAIAAIQMQREHVERVAHGLQGTANFVVGFFERTFFCPADCGAGLGSVLY